MKKLWFPAASALLLALAGCYNDKANELYPGPVGSACDTTNATYTGMVKAIVDQNCAFSGCHAGAAPGAGYDMTTYTGLKAAVTAGRLMGAIRHENGFSPMPKNTAKMSDCNIAKIQAWVNAGTPQ